MKRVINIFLVLLAILFLSLYFSNYNNEYYQNKTYLTEEAIKKYEDDLRNNKPITSKNYLPKEKDYNNSASRIGIKTSNFLENIINKSLKFIAKYLE